MLSAGGAMALTQSAQNSASSNQNSTQTIPAVEKIEPKVETRAETETSKVPYETVTTQDATLAKGSTKVTTEGENGIREKVYEVTYTDGVETDRQLVSDTITKQPVNRTVAEGTYVAPTVKSTTQSTPATQCTNGTYVNSAGNTVCRPSETNTGGATARCKDGSYSYSQSRSGTCSHHGGVAQWL